MKSDSFPAQEELTFGLTGYFAKTIFPLEVWGRQQTITAETPVLWEKDNYFLLVRSGCGRIYVNQIEWNIRRGSLLCLGPFHAYRIEPDPGETLDILEAHINNGAYLYVLACPSIKIHKMLIPNLPATVQLSLEDTQIAEATLLDYLRVSSPDCMNHKLCFLYIMELFGLLLSNEKRSQFPFNH